MSFAAAIVVGLLVYIDASVGIYVVTAAASAFALDIVFLLERNKARDRRQDLRRSGRSVSREDEPLFESECCRLLDKGHHDHEEIVRLLQDMADPRAIPYLKKAVEMKPSLEYLAYDDYGAFYKKCLWALQDIGTPESIAIIEEFAQAEDPVLREEASYRLSKLTSTATHPSTP